MYGLIGKLKTHPGQRDVFLGYLTEGVSALRQMEGCYQYVVSKATDDPDTIWVTEVWRSEADHRESLNNEAVRAIITAARPLLAEPPGGFEVIPIGGVGLPENKGE